VFSQQRKGRFCDNREINCSTRCPLFGTPRTTSTGLLEITGDENPGDRIRQKTEEVRNEVVLLCGVVTVTFRLVSLFLVTKCYSYSKILSQLIVVSSWRISNKSIHLIRNPVITCRVITVRDKHNVTSPTLKWVFSKIFINSSYSLPYSVRGRVEPATFRLVA
jgi:hypothetical protein